MFTKVDVLLSGPCQSTYDEDRPTLEHHVYVGRARASSLQLPIPANSMKHTSISPTFRTLNGGRSLHPCLRNQRHVGCPPNTALGCGQLEEPSSFLNLSLSRARILKSDEKLPIQHGTSRDQRLRVSRDNEQPLSGSLSNLHRRCSEGSFIDATSEESVDVEEDEQADSLGALEPSRQRASTCPETKAFRRHLKAKMMMRPPSPPLPDASNILRRLSSEAISRSNGSLNRCFSEELLIEDEEFVDSCSISVAPDLPVIVETN